MRGQASAWPQSTAVAVSTCVEAAEEGGGGTWGIDALSLQPNISPTESLEDAGESRNSPGSSLTFHLSAVLPGPPSIQHQAWLSAGAHCVAVKQRGLGFSSAQSRNGRTHLGVRCVCHTHQVLTATSVHDKIFYCTYRVTFSWGLVSRNCKWDC